MKPKLRSDLRKQVDRDQYSDRRTEEQKDYLADEMFHEEHPYRDYGGLRSRKYTPNRIIQVFEKIISPIFNRIDETHIEKQINDIRFIYVRRIYNRIDQVGLEY